MTKGATNRMSPAMSMLNQRATTAVMALAGKIDRLASPDEVLAALEPIAAIANVTVFGVWRWSMRPDDISSYVLGRTLFSPVKYVDRFINDLRVLRRRHGPSVTVRRVCKVAAASR